jgi:AcrR family transcriptional regulator
VVVEQGYARSTIAEITSRAGVSRKTFYRHFDGKLECLLEAYDAIASEYIDAVTNAYGADGDPVERARAGLEALFERAAADPGALRLVTVEIAGTGEAGLARREKLITRFEWFMRESLALEPRRDTISNPILRAVVGGLSRVLRTDVRSGDQADVPQLVDDLMNWASSYSDSAPAATSDPKRTSPNTSNDVWGRRAPGTLWLQSLEENAGGFTTSGHGLSHSFLVHSQRERILDAVANLTARHGYAALTVDGIAEEAGVSLGVLNEHFAGKEDAFLVAYELGHSKGLAIVERAFFAESDWRAGVHAGISALFDFLASEPSFARLALVDALIATRRSAGRSKLGVGAYAQILLPGLENMPQGSTPPAVLSEAITGGIFELCLGYALKGRIGELSELVPHATYFALTPFIGAEEAVTIATNAAL